MQYPMRAIGRVDAPFKEKFGIPRQPGLTPAVEATIHVDPVFANGLRALDGFSHAWVLFVFHGVAADEARPMVRPPRLGGNKKVGVFATRSPFRPNRIGLSLVRIAQVEAAARPAFVRVTGADLLDETPVLDLKPYVPYADRPTEPVRTGWLDELPPTPRVRVTFADRAEKTVRALTEAGYPRLRAVIEEVLRLDPRPAIRVGEGEAGEQRYGARLFDFDVRWRTAGDRCEVIEIVRSP